MKKLFTIIVICLIGFALIGCETTPEQEEVIDDIIEEVIELDIAETDTVIITATYPIWAGHSIRNGNIYMHELNGLQISNMKIWDNGILEVVFTDGMITYIHEYLSVDIV